MQYELRHCWFCSQIKKTVFWKKDTYKDTINIVKIRYRIFLNTVIKVSEDNVGKDGDLESVTSTRIELGKTSYDLAAWSCFLFKNIIWKQVENIAIVLIVKCHSWDGRSQNTL